MAFSVKRRHNAKLRIISPILQGSLIGFCDAGLCFVESKAVAVLSTDPDRPTERRARNIQKEIDKGLTRLCGAIRSVAIGLPLTSRAGKPIHFPREMGWVRHSIIMVSELLPSIDWETVGVQLLNRSQTTGSMFHVLDLRELRFLVGVSKDKPTMFMMHLMQRFQILSECKSAYIRTWLSGLPLP